MYSLERQRLFTASRSGSETGIGSDGCGVQVEDHIRQAVGVRDKDSPSYWERQQHRPGIPARTVLAVRVKRQYVCLVCVRVNEESAISHSLYWQRWLDHWWTLKANRRS